MRSFGDHQRGGDERAVIGFEQIAAGVVVGVIAVGGSDQHTGVNDQHA